MKTKDESRKWMWMFLAALVSLQMYFVWELLAVFALFAVGFAAIAFRSEACTCCTAAGHWPWSASRRAGTRLWWPCGRASTRSKTWRAERFGVRVLRQPAKFLTTFWPWPEHTQSLSPCLLQD